jgi:hypothetical protein
MAREDWIDPLDMTARELKEFREKCAIDKNAWARRMYVQQYRDAREHPDPDPELVAAMEWAVDNRALHRLRGDLKLPGQP